MYFYMLPDCVKKYLLAIASTKMTFIFYSLIITAITFGIVMLLIMFNHAFRDDEGKVPIKINKMWVLLFAIPFVNIFVLIGSIIIFVHIIINHGHVWIKEKSDD